MEVTLSLYPSPLTRCQIGINCFRACGLHSQLCGCASVCVCEINFHYWILRLRHHYRVLIDTPTRVQTAGLASILHILDVAPNRPESVENFHRKMTKWQSIFALWNAVGTCQFCFGIGNAIDWLWWVNTAHKARVSHGTSAWHWCTHFIKSIQH